MRVSQIQGLKYPDSYVIRFFFKEGLHRRPGRVLEPGCGNGNNLLLFADYGWGVTGIDVDEPALAAAESNFARLAGAAPYRFHARDLDDGLPEEVAGPYDCLCLANIVCYLDRARCAGLLSELGGRLAAGAAVFLRTRTPGDYRYGRGREVGENAFALDISETGEEGALNVFYHRHELVDLMVEGLRVSPETLKIHQVEFQNHQNGVLISNADLVLWGRVGDG